jgi:hypothetical protein
MFPISSLFLDIAGDSLSPYDDRARGRPFEKGEAKPTKAVGSLTNGTQEKNIPPELPPVTKTLAGSALY